MIKRMKKILLSTTSALLFLAAQADGLDWCSNYTYNDCCTCESFWGSAEYLYWDLKDGPRVPALVVSESCNCDGASKSETKLGCEKLDSKWRSGGKFALGYWFDCEHCFGAELNYFVLPNTSRKHSVHHSECGKDEALRIPFCVIGQDCDDSTDLSFPGVFDGWAKLKESNMMQGAELNGWMTIPSTCDYKAGWLVGFRYWNFDEHLKFTTCTPTVGITNDIWATKDKFRVENNFYGGQIGFGMETAYDQFYLNGKVKLALGALCAERRISGGLLTNEFNEPPFDGEAAVYEGGYFALPSRIGHRKTTKFAVIPDVNINIGYQFTDCFRIQVGYTFLYINRVLRAGKQFDNCINPEESLAIQGNKNALVANCESHSRSLRTSSLWAQGLNVGIEFQF